MTFKWFVVHCYPNKESVAALNIQQQGFSTYIPRYKKLRRHARRVDTVLAPLFPRYFFVKLDQEVSHWVPINNTPGVNYLLKNNDGTLSSVPTNIIEELYKKHDEQGLVTLSVLELFKQGDRVRILDGAFVNHTAIYEKMTDNQRVQLLITLIQREVKIIMPLYALEKV
jgi:transcriptional antiterminator RfaH